MTSITAPAVEATVTTRRRRYFERKSLAPLLLFLVPSLVLFTIFVVLPSIVLVYLLVVPIRGSLGGSFIDLVKDLILLAVGLAVYGALFAFVGAKFKRPILTGLVFIFGWEQAALLFPGYLKRFTVAYYLQGLVPHAMPSDGVVSLLQSVFREVPSALTSLFWLFFALVLSLMLATRVVERREYVLEQ